MIPEFERLALGALSGTARHRRLTILTYHRVLDEFDAMTPEEPSAASFESQMRWIRELMHPLLLPDAADMLQDGTLPPRAVCITFDDGYRNNFEIAAPILARWELPATFFIATGVLEEGAMWNDLVIESVRHSGNRFDLRSFGLSDYRIDNEGERANVAGRVLDSMKYLAQDERSNLARRIYSCFCDEEVPSLMMTAEMVGSLATQGFDVGAHTVSHPILSRTDDRRAFDEIVGSRDWVEEVTGLAPRSFAYPNGRPDVDFTARHQDMVRDAGFTCAVSTQWGCAVPGSDPMSLPRFTPWEISRYGFITRLAKTYVRSYLPSALGV